MTLENKLITHLRTFCENVLAEINTELVEAIPEQENEVLLDKPTKVKKIEDDILGNYSDEPYKEFILSKTKTKHRKVQDTYKLDTAECRWVLNRRNGDLKDIQWQEFADRMNEEFGLNKCKNSWANIVYRKTAYYQSLDY